jgi:DNA polymerase III subunit beta
LEIKSPLAPLVEALKLADKFTASGSNSPILTGIHAQVQGQELTLTAYDGLSQVRTTVAITDGVDGASVIGRETVGYLAALPGGDVHLVAQDAKLTVHAGVRSGEFRIADAENFPSLRWASDQEVELDAASLRAALRHVVFAASSDAGRQALTGVLFQSTDNNGTAELRLVATDTYRLSVRSLGATSIEAGTSLLIPAATLARIEALLGTVDKVKVRTGESDLTFVFGGVEVGTRLIDATFPDYQRVVPASTDNAVAFEVDAAIDALKRMKPLVSSANRAMKVAIAENEVVFTASSDVATKLLEPVEATITGTPVEFAVNIDYFLEALEKGLGSGPVTVHVADALKPLRVSRDNHPVLQVVMPVNPSVVR